MASSPPSTTSPTSRSRAPPSRPTRCPGRAWWSATAGSCSEPRAMNDPLAAIRASAAKYPAIALVLQGGGALGAYQCGVYQSLPEAGIRPNWLAGLSIGAINAAIIAGNVPDAPVDLLPAFWDEICQPAEAPRKTD